jgi:arylsulfatase A-like enzyme
MRMTRRQWLAISAVAGVGAGAAHWTSSQPAPRRHGRFPVPDHRPFNILLIVSDQERAWQFYPPNFIDQHTPARAWLRNNGVSFTNAHTPTPICSTARGVIYSGQHSPNNMLWDNVPFPLASPLRPDIPTLGSLFGDAGYITGYAGKWHISKLANSDQSPAAEIQSYGFMETEVAGELDGPRKGYLHDQHTVDAALRFIGRHQGGEKPWFQAVNLVNPHDIMYYTAGDAMTQSRVSRFPDASARPPRDPLYAEDLGYPLTENFGPATFGQRPKAVREYGLTFDASMGKMPYDDADAGRDMQNYYWNCTRDCDRHLQRLIDGLHVSGEVDRTVIVFVADHGELLGAHGLRGKGTAPLREAVNVPLVVVHPEGAQGVTSNALISHLDLTPTLLAFAGIKAKALKDQFPELNGRDFSGLVADPDDRGPRAKDGLLFHWTSFAFLDHRSVARFTAALDRNPVRRFAELTSILHDSSRQRGLMRGSMNSQYKFARYFSPRSSVQPHDWESLIEDSDFELYDLQSDPGETTNLAVDPQRYREPILTMNALTNRLAASEIGADDGAYLPMIAKL